MRIRVIGVLLVVVIVGCGITATVLCTRQVTPAESATTSGKMPGADFVARRSRTELEKGMAEARTEREKSTGTVATDTSPETAYARKMQGGLAATKNPADAEAEARSRLDEISKELQSATAVEDRERLERQKRLVEEVLAKMGKM